MQQYIDFYQSYHQKINESCSPLLNEYREEAFRSFQEKGLPEYRSEDYRYTNIEELLKPDYGFFLGFKGKEIDPYQVFKCSMTNLSSHLQFMINGHFYHHELSHQLPEGVFSGSLNVFASEYPELFKKHYHVLAKEKGNGLTDFNTLFVQDGYVLYLPENTIIENPIQLTNVFNGKMDALINRRILIILEAGASAKLLVCDHCLDEEMKRAATQVTEIYLAGNAVFDFYELEESTDKSVRLTDNFVRQQASSNLMLNNITLSNGITRNNYCVDLEGCHSEARLYGMAIADKKQRVDNFTAVNHNVPDCHSDELFKYILSEESLGVFRGMIKVAVDAQRTQAYQNNRNLLSGDSCRMFSKPQLEIYADDVKCSHGMTTGQLDESALFYLRSRGIPEAEARILLRFAFADDVIQGIRLENLRERLRLLIEKRFRGEPIKCQGCI